jgi:transportin-1
MVYSEEELVGLPVDDIDDTKVPDNQRDIRPSFHTSKSGATTLAEDDEESENENDVDHAETWTLRKSAAAALDALAETWENELLPHLLGPLKALLSSGEDSNWLRVESGILALGCVSLLF